MPALRGASALCYAVFFFYLHLTVVQAGDRPERKKVTDDFLSRVEPSAALLQELESVLGQTFGAKLGKLKTQIEPMFQSLPKRSGKFLSPATARYALHRFNMDRHGWSINGIQATRDAFNTTQLVVSDILSGLLPEHILAIFERHIDADGITFEDVSMMARTIEHFVHEDQKGIVRTVAEGLELPTVGPMQDDHMRNTIKTYLIIFLQYITYDDVNKHKSFEQFFKEAEYMYPGWGDSVLLVDDETDTLLELEKDVTNPFKDRESSMELALRVVEKLADHFPNRHWDLECKQIKSDLMEHDTTNTGRIRLSDFYRAGLTSKYFYVETLEYLRAIGALDDTDPVWGPKVIIPNYVQAESNCLASNNIYSVCCMDECEGLYSHLEKEIAAAEASPELIISLVSGLSSSTVHAPRNLSAAFASRLYEIAVAHGGKVIMHSRLFAQWMHQAFPSECRYPHLAGTTAQIPADQWEDQTGLNARIDHEGKETRRETTLRHIEELDAKLVSNNETLSGNAMDGNGALMWSLEDEHLDHLVAPRVSIATWLGRSFRYLRYAVCFLLIAIAVTTGLLPNENKEVATVSEPLVSVPRSTLTV